MSHRHPVDRPRTSGDRGEHLSRLDPGQYRLGRRTICPEPVGGGTELRILAFRAHLTGPDDLMSDFERVRPVVPTWLTPTDSDVTAHFQVLVDTPRAGRHLIIRDGIPWGAARRRQIIPYLDLAINSTAVAQLGALHLFFHAGAVAARGQGVIFPAVSGSGKTTLVAGLLTAGFQYLSDEVAVLDPTTKLLHPFPKSLLVKSGSRRALNPLYPDLGRTALRQRFGNATVWYLAPPEDSWPKEPVPVRYVIFPHYQPRSRTQVVAMSRGEAFGRLLRQSFNLRRHGGRGIRCLTEVLREAKCYRLQIGNLTEAVQLVDNLITGPGEAAGGCEEMTSGKRRPGTAGADSTGE